MHTRRRLVAALTLTALALAGCASDDASDVDTLGAAADADIDPEIDAGADGPADEAESDDADEDTDAGEDDEFAEDEANEDEPEDTGADEPEDTGADEPEIELGDDTGDDQGSPFDGTEVAAATAAVFEEFGSTSPGCAVGVLRAGERFVDAFGMADIDAGIALEPDSIFDIGSVSKQLTAGAIALAVLDGDLSLDDDVTSLVDEIGPFDQVVTVADLIHHTSGLPDYTVLLDADDDEVTTNADALATISGDGVALNFEPGAAFEYSNTNYVLMAEIVDRVSGQSLVEFSADRIFEPLGMSDSVVRDDQGELLEGQAQGYGDESDSGDWQAIGSSWRQTGDGAVHATVDDLLTWAELFLPDAIEADGGIGSSQWRALMLQPGPVADGGSAYAFGIGLEEDGELLTHAGSWIGYSSSLAVRPADDLAVAVACNIDLLDADSLVASVMDIWR
jgi:CubicO group peptidase (beta-lactamase class C family)